MNDEIVGMAAQYIIKMLTVKCHSYFTVHIYLIKICNHFVTIRNQIVIDFSKIF